MPEVNLVTPDTYDSLYNYGESKFANNDYSMALEAFKNICDKDTTSKYYLRSAYAAGWIFENILNNPDSAVIYYSKIQNKDPKSEICKLVNSKLIVYKEEIQQKEDSLKNKGNNTVDSSKNHPDTLGNENNKPEIKDEKPEGQLDNTKEKEKEGTNIPDIKKENDPNSGTDNTK
jgi:tetratricopeptide (TPR) repeat protein